ncbi:DUF3310 domain-containing protein [Staphylococcus nepalensis]|uniref:Phage protein n=1 Tax=Staphylococcus nepalensis TaxID=214473 RepID=A0A380GPA6_9STAP|nr:DUF3310 domain-containing protein [Staphylococcus nepalensis]POA01069.1 hypothetical protein CD130_00650 [Staphylococcus nepalensis]GGB85609.1 hypothetical protein GCM10007203_16040 [Staphylococcus nepalensis]SUM55425.1 phage protein [Staphylococcus nepalensis]VDG67398.1 Protein of unknwon function (DUF3310) [Lacrimispora indolis]
MKIRDLNINDYVIVYDLGKSEYSEGMTVVGRVDEIIFNEDDKNEAGIDSLGNFYHFDDSNYFDLWSNYIESKTERVSTPNPGKIYSYSNSTVGPNEEIISHKQSNDVQQRKRNEQNVKPDYYQFEDFEMYEIVEAICKHYNPVVAAWIGQAIQYIGRAPRKNGKEDIAKARDMIERAFEVWDVK